MKTPGLLQIKVDHDEQLAMLAEAARCPVPRVIPQFFTFGVQVPDDPGSIEPGKHVVFFTSRVAVQ